MTLKNTINHLPIPTYIINLVKRPQRKKNVLKEFSGRNEFDVHVIQAIEDSFGARGLWRTICKIIELVPPEAEYIIICEDDHKFTNAYSEEALLDSIEKAISHKCDILLGGVSWHADSVQVDENLFAHIICFLVFFF
ncbi:MAG: hypothetical protein EOO43_18625, partial [Flavobacterium sp.]